MTVRLAVRPASFRPPFGKELKRMGNMRPALERAVAIRRAQIADEFDAEAGFTAGGGRVSWPPTADFGNRRAPTKTLHRTGSLRRAFMGSGSGAIERYTKDSATFGSSGAVHPQARILRRGGRIRITPAMRGFVAASFGAHFRRTKRYIEFRPRPYGEATPQTRERIREAFADYITEGVA